MENKEQYKTKFDVPVDIVHQCIDMFNHSVDDNTHIDILQEECAELIQALSKLKRNKKNAMGNVHEEITHVLLSAAIFCELHGINNFIIAYEIYRKAVDNSLNTESIQLQEILYKELDEQISKISKNKGDD